MDLHESVKKATELFASETNAKFYRLKGLSQAEKDRKMNERVVKVPQNLNLLENDIDDNTNENDINKISPSFDRHAVNAAIKEVNGGLDLSNKTWEKYWAKHLEDINSDMKKSCESSSYQDTEINSKDLSESSNHQLIKEKKKIFRNAAIMGLVNTNKISLEDLADLSNNCTKEENRLKTLVKTNNEHQIEFVPLREDPDIFVHPLRMGIDVKKFKDLDFTVPRVGKKIKETPPEYFIRTTDDDSFKFVKKNKGAV